MDWKALMNTLGSGIDLKDFSTSNTEPDYSTDETKGLFGKKDEIAALENEVAALTLKKKKSEDTTMYIIIGVLVAFILGLFKIK
jgi:hypothetical protein